MRLTSDGNTLIGKGQGSSPRMQSSIKRLDGSSDDEGMKIDSIQGGSGIEKKKKTIFFCEG